MRKRTESETKLVERAAYDIDAFGELVERFRDSIIGQCYSRVRDRHYAEDLAQETFVRAYLKLDQLRQPESFAGWLRRIASNTCSEFLRSPARQEYAWDEVAMPQRGGQILSYAVELDLRPLNEEQQQCVELFYGGQLSYSEIAEILGISVVAVRNRLHRAKILLREGMDGMSGEKRSPFTERLIERLERMKSNDPAERNRAAREVHTALAEDRVEWMVSRLEQADPMERTFAIRRSRRIRSPRVRDALIRILLNDEWEENRIKAANALVAQGDKAAISQLTQAMESAGNLKDVAAAARSAIRQLEKLAPLADGEAESLRFRHEVSAASSGRRSRLELLRYLQVALDDPSPKVRNQALKALAELGDKRGVPAIARLLNDSVPGVQQSAASALGRLGGKQAVSALVKVLAESSDKRLLQTAALAVGEAGDPSALVPLLEAALRQDNWQLFAMAAHKGVLEKLARHEDVPRIKRLIEAIQARFADMPVIRHYYMVLGRLADERDVPELISVLADAAGTDALWPVAEALGRIGDQRAVGVLRSYLWYRNREEHAVDVRYTAARALAKLGEPGLRIVREALKSDDWAIRLPAVRALFFGYVHDEASSAILKTLAETDPNASVRMYAKGVLFRMKKGRKQ